MAKSAVFTHTPVLLEEAIKLLNIRAGKLYIDATAGGGGHLSKILSLLGDEGKCIGLDRDPQAIEFLRQRLNYQDSSKLKLINANFANMQEALDPYGINQVDGGIIADLGISSKQLDDPERGFSFSKDGPLDMRMDSNQKLTAYDLINGLSENELAKVIYQYGEEHKSKIIARKIVQARPLSTTRELAAVVLSSLGARRKSHRTKQRGAYASTRGKEYIQLHPATKTFQAIRIAVNAELDCLQTFLEQSSALLAPGARLVIITFHSLEDRLVKQFFKRKASHCLCPPKQPICNCGQKPEFLIITRKPIVASEQEVLANIRSRSAKLRTGEKLP